MKSRAFVYIRPHIGFRWPVGSDREPSGLHGSGTALADFLHSTPQITIDNGQKRALSRE